MSALRPVLECSYGFHGIGVDVYARDRSVLDALDLRLRAFGGPDREASDRLALVFSVEEHEAAPADASGRPVYETPHGTLTYLAEEDRLSGRFGGVGLRCDATRGVAVFQAARFVGRDLYLATHPLCTIALMELLKRRGLFTLHTACMATPDGHGILVAGPSGAGKSTLALSLVRAGMAFVSDDLVFLDPGPGGAIRVLGFADAIGVADPTAERFTELELAVGAGREDGFPKRLYRVEELYGATPVSRCEPSVLVFPQVVLSQPSRIVPLDPGEAFLRLVPDVLLTEPAATQRHLDAIAALLRQVPCYVLRFGRDLEHAASLVRSLA